jgi:hypothetical protein
MKEGIVNTVVATLLIGSVNMGNAVGFGVNLIENPGAEGGLATTDEDLLVGVIPGWTLSGNFNVIAYGFVGPSGPYPTLADPGPSYRGNNFFTGGPNLEGCIAAERAPERSENGGDQVARGASKYTPS